MEFPCSHGEVIKNPPLVEGGFSPGTEVTVTVRSELFNLRPKRGDLCVLTERHSPDSAAVVFNLRVQTIGTSAGDSLLTMLCVDANQGV